MIGLTAAFCLSIRLRVLDPKAHYCAEIADAPMRFAAEVDARMAAIKVLP